MNHDVKSYYLLMKTYIYKFLLFNNSSLNLFEPVNLLVQTFFNKFFTCKDIINSQINKFLLFQ